MDELFGDDFDIMVDRVFRRMQSYRHMTVKDFIKEVNREPANFLEESISMAEEAEEDR